ncbi:MAG: tRNA pseudouridine(55) synthase TruB [Blastocatellia bacterium]
MDGILIVDKPGGPTSHDVVARIRRIFGVKRVGHTGTLDPFATGVLVVLIGQATRLLRFFEKDKKEYEAIIRFGAETDTGDLTGRAISKSKTEEEITQILQQADWYGLAAKFRGKIKQMPPMYSAKKIAGQKLYELARSGIEIQRPAVEITIDEISLTPMVADRCTPEAELRVRCSAGTYIRTLAEEIGRAVGIGAHLSSLRRTRAGSFSLQDAVRMEILTAAREPARFVRPMEEAVKHLPLFQLEPNRVAPTRSGMPTRAILDAFAADEWIRMIDQDGRLVALRRFDANEKLVRPRIVFN